MIFSIHNPPFLDRGIYKSSIQLTLFYSTQNFWISYLFTIYCGSWLTTKVLHCYQALSLQIPTQLFKGQIYSVSFGIVFLSDEFIRALRGIDYSTAFLVKVWFTMNPAKGLISGIICFVMLNSYILFLNERMAQVDVIDCYFDDRAQQNLQYRDAIWLTMVTFLTVGYGDYYPTTNLGRYMMIITVMGGQLYSALVIGMIHGQLMLTSEESGVLNIISNNRKEKNKRYISATLIYYILKMAGARNRHL